MAILINKKPLAFSGEWIFGIVNEMYARSLHKSLLVGFCILIAEMIEKFT